MFYNNINNTKTRIFIVILNCFLILVYLNSMIGCETTGLYNVSPGDLETGSTSEIKKIELKNGTVINCTGKMIKIERESDSTVVFVITSVLNIKSQDSAGRNVINPNDIRIPEKVIKTILVELTKEDDGMTTVAIAGGILLVGVIICLFSFRQQF